jgi:hypothetical protein
MPRKARIDGENNGVRSPHLTETKDRLVKFLMKRVRQLAINIWRPEPVISSNMKI